MVEDVQSAVEGALEDLGRGGQETEYLPSSSESDEDGAPEKSRSELKFPKLAPSPAQFEMIRALDAVGFTKHPVHIHTDRHSHAAIIARRKNRPSQGEAEAVMRHWLDADFVV